MASAGNPLHEHPVSFETLAALAPQDEEVFVAQRRVLILRRPRSGRLEGRTMPFQSSCSTLVSRVVKHGQ
jgi:hypothetical protein